MEKYTNSKKGEIMNKLKELGREGEERAAVYLDSRGYEILERNFRCSFGEIDIIAMDGDTLCFIEVKTRRNFRFGTPAEAVTERKQMHLQRCAHVFMRRYRGKYRDIRIDIIEVIADRGSFFVRHLVGGRSA